MARQLSTRNGSCAGAWQRHHGSLGGALSRRGPSASPCGCECPPPHGTADPSAPPRGCSGEQVHRAAGVRQRLGAPAEQAQLMRMPLPLQSPAHLRCRRRRASCSRLRGCAAAASHSSCRRSSQCERRMGSGARCSCGSAAPGCAPSAPVLPPVLPPAAAAAAAAVPLPLPPAAAGMPSMASACRASSARWLGSAAAAYPA